MRPCATTRFGLLRLLRPGDTCWCVSLSCGDGGPRPLLSFTTGPRPPGVFVDVVRAFGVLVGLCLGVRGKGDAAVLSRRRRRGGGDILHSSCSSFPPPLFARVAGGGGCLVSRWGDSATNRSVRIVRVSRISERTASLRCISS